VFEKNNKFPSTISSVWWGFIGSWVGGVTFAAIFYLLEDYASKHEFLPVIIWLFCIVFGIFSFREGNKKVKKSDSANPESRISFSQKFSWTLLGFLGAGFITWVSVKSIFNLKNGELLPFDYSIIYIFGLLGGISVWEYKVLKEENEILSFVESKLKKIFN
jgi:hypothetical protein